jgi:aromatic ring-cleaving dioxygenase
MATKDGGGGWPWQKGSQTIQDEKVVSLGRDVQFKIGQHLRTMYDEVVKQGVPDQFSDLLQQLDEPSGKFNPPDDKTRR